MVGVEAFEVEPTLHTVLAPTISEGPLEADSDQKHTLLVRGSEEPVVVTRSLLDKVPLFRGMWSEAFAAPSTDELGRVVVDGLSGPATLKVLLTYVETQAKAKKTSPASVLIPATLDLPALFKDAEYLGLELPPLKEFEFESDRHAAAMLQSISLLNAQVWCLISRVRRSRGASLAHLEAPPV